MSFTLPASAGFALRAAATFASGFPGTRTSNDDPEAVSFAWPLDGDWRSASVVLHQQGNDIRGEIDGPHTPEIEALVRRDVERILCLDVDASQFSAVGRHDPIVGELQKRFAGLRPVLFYTPYEAAAWSIIGQRIQMTQAATIKQRLADEYGERGAFPPPARLSELASPQRGLTAKKVEQLRQLGAAAITGVLDRDRLLEQRYDDAEKQLRELPGIGPFSAELILIRGMGAPDALPRHENRLHVATRTAYGLPSNADIDVIADRWRPYRSWVALLLRAAA